MDYSIEERSKHTLTMCLQESSKNPVEIFHKIAKQEFIRIHGPEHHILDGAALLTAFYNAGGVIDLPQSLEELMRRSQIAEALGKKYLSDSFECYSAGTETKSQINQDAVRLMKEGYDIDMEETQYSKLLADIPAPDVAISMGCNVSCPFMGRDFDENWGLEDPTGKSDEEFVKVIREIERRVLLMTNL